jgi:hypothetical protein
MKFGFQPAEALSLLFLWLWFLSKEFNSSVDGFVILSANRIIGLRHTSLSHHLTICHQSSIIDRLNLNDNFNRWKYMQNLLNEDLTGSDVNPIVFYLLKSYHDRASRILSCDVDDIVDLSPEPSAEKLEHLCRILSVYSNGIIPVLHEDGSPGDADALCFLEVLLPSLEEDEDAYRGTWDTVMELHGRAAVSVLESQGETSWQTVLTVAKVMIHFGFLGNEWLCV